MKTARISNVLRSSIFALFFAASLAISGCSADAIMGPDTTDGPTLDARSEPHGQHPGNDDCSVGGC